jgi:ATP-dependent Lon protease
MLLDPTLRIPLESLPVVPLPHTVLFPEQQLPLHIFEPRYRQMVRDALEGSPYLVVALIQGDAAREPTAFARVATAGRIVTHQRLADGRFNILVEGAVRVACEEIPSANLYRRVRCVALPEPEGEAAAVPATERAAMLSLVGLVMQAARARSPGMEFVPPTGLPPARLAFKVADRLVADATARQWILEADTARARVSRTTEALAQALGDIAPRTSRGSG